MLYIFMKNDTLGEFLAFVEDYRTILKVAIYNVKPSKKHIVH